MTEKRKLYREYTKAFEDNGLKWDEVYVTMPNNTLPRGPLSMNGIHKYWNLLSLYWFGSVRWMLPRRHRRAITLVFKLPSDDLTATYFALQGLHQSDAKDLVELKTLLDA